MNADMRDRVLELGARDVRVMPMGARLSSLARPPVTAGTGPTRVLAVGRLVDKKGFDVLIDAIAAMTAGGSDADVIVTVVGDGPERAALERRAEGLHVTFAGQLGRDALDRAYADADIAVFASRRAESGDQDGLPVAMLEAMGAGCAVVASDLPGLNEAIVDGDSGVLLPQADVPALAAALSALTSDRSERERLGAAARARASSYSVEAVSAGYRSLVLEILARA
jgi:glycosyltransferase involved in cell wall biosynthesis